MKDLPKMLKVALVVILVIVLLGILTTALRAQPIACGDAVAGDKALAEKYGEAPLATGIGQAGERIVWWGNAETGTWSLMMYVSETQACMLKSGKDLMLARVKPNI